MLGRISLLSFATVILASGLAGSGVALPIAPLNQAQVGDLSNVVEVAQKKGGGGGGKAKAAKGGGGKVKAAKGGGGKVKAAKGGGGKASKGAKAGKHVNKKVTTKHVNRRVIHRTVVVRPYRAWYSRPYYGAVIAGVTLGTIIAVSAPRIVPVAPSDALCWYWSNPEQLNGYWDYCTPPL